MEGKKYRSLRENSIVYGGAVVFMMSVIAVAALVMHMVSAPPEPALRIERRGGAFIIIKNEREYVLPSIFSEQPDPDREDFYTRTYDCRVSVMQNSRSAESLEQWITTGDEQLSLLTVEDKTLHFLDEDKRRALYTVETAETGKSVMYYEDYEGYVFEVRVYAEDPLSTCYDEFEKQFTQ